MRILLLAILLVGAPLMAVETEPEDPAASPEEPPASNADKPKATGPLSTQESKLQGDWQAYEFKSGEKSYKMTFKGREFRADVRDEWYEGYIAIRTDDDPAHLDFLIEDCRCGFKGRASTGIFYWDGETIIVSAPAPGEARPREFKEDSGTMLRLKPEGRD
jgi:uncharacterized protein (TIGR03067 family)